MVRFFLFSGTLLIPILLSSQVNYTANDAVIPYSGQFRSGINTGYYQGWSTQQLADISAGNPDLHIPGVGARTLRSGAREEVFEYFNYEVLKPDFEHFSDLNMGEHVMIAGAPVGWHKDYTEYCPGQPSALFANLYSPIWDNGANGTPYNDNNYYAAYLYKLVNTYKDDVRFWEIWNEPGYDLTGNLGWRGPDYPGNWWLEGPDPCDNILHAPIYHYIRILRISWEIIKTLDPDSYVCLGSVGYQSMMNAILRNTDNPNNGDVADEFPLTGGAYFDCVSYHSYPHFDGSTTNYDLNFFQRHSDQAADGVLKYRDYYQEVLTQYGYDGTVYPKKEWIVTEINSPRKAFTGTYFAGIDQQINHLMKAYMVAKVNKVHQLHWFQLFDQTNEWEASYEFHQMGMYKKLNGAGPYQQQYNDEGKAAKTVSDLIYNTEYDPVRTQEMGLPPELRGYAFKRTDGSWIYAVWARTTQDLSEAAYGMYSFPTTWGMTQVQRYDWDYGITGNSYLTAAQGIHLNARPVFFTAPASAPACSLSALIEDIHCDDNGTADPKDDLFFFNITVNSLGGGANGWSASVAGQTVVLNGPYGQLQHTGPWLISGGAVVLNIEDSGNPMCTLTQTISAPAPCSEGSSASACTTVSEFPWHDWIGKVSVGSFMNESGKSTYADFTTLGPITAAPGQLLPVNLRTSYSWETFDETWKIWADFNQNGVWEEPSEVVLEEFVAAPPNGTPFIDYQGWIEVPANALPGATKMRITMQRGEGPVAPCGTISFGETEDYTLFVIPFSNPQIQTLKPQNALSYHPNLTPNPVFDAFMLNNLPAEHFPLEVTISDINGRKLKMTNCSKGGQVEVSELSVGAYTVQVLTAKGEHFALKMMKIR